MDCNADGGIYFNTGSLPERDRFPAVREEFARQLLRIEAVNHSTAPFSAVFDVRSTGKLVTGRIDTSPADYVRTPELIRDGQEYFFVTLNFEGTMFCSQPHASRRLCPGDAVLLDSTHTGGIHFRTNARYLTMRVPRLDITRALPQAGPLAGLPLNRNIAARRLLFGYLNAARTVDLGSGRTAELYEQHIIDLVLLALGAAGEARELAQERGLRAARLAAVLRAIDQRSGDPGLNAVKVAAMLGVTPRYVHLLLEETGQSFSQHLLERRLAKSAALLRDPRWRHRKIADVALQAGFTDLSNFSRAFRRRFGATPSEIRVAAR